MSKEHAQLLMDVQGAFEMIKGNKHYLPTTIFLNGGVLNEQLKTDIYDASKAYIISNNGIREITEGDEV